MTDPRWYCITSDGAATLCVDRADAEQNAADADIQFPRWAPHRAVQLVEAAPQPQQAAPVAVPAVEAVPILIKALRDAQAFIDGIRSDLHNLRATDWFPEGAHDAAHSMSGNMRLIGNACADFDCIGAALEAVEALAASPQAAPAPAVQGEPPDSLQVTAAWQDFGRQQAFRDAAKWAQDGEIPGALFVAFRAGMFANPSPQAQAAPAPPQQAPAPQPVALTDEQIRKIEDNFSNEFGLEAKHSLDFAHAVITEFCCINGITQPSQQEQNNV